MQKITAILIFISVLTFTFSCRKDGVDTSQSLQLNFSTGSVLFDTVFTTFGSTTKRLKIYNPSSSPVNISSISVGNGANSQFRINVDGVSGNAHKDVFLGGKDSLFIFAEVTIDPNNILSPFVVNDKINFITNGNTQSITLEAWGQNAHYFVANKSVNGIALVYLDRVNSDAALNSTWINDKPYVIYGGYLTLDGDDKLTIDPGVRIHMHNGAGLWVFEDGNINVNGTKDEPVTFQGTRLEHAYQDVSGQWDRIWINNNTNGTDNVFNYAIIKNGFIGIQAEPNPFIPIAPVSTNKLRLNNCVIHNNTVAGILTKNYQITDTNSVISNAGQHSLLVQGDGSYQFYHTTFANYWDQSTRKTPSILLQNAYVNNEGNTIVSNLTAVDFYNCIIHGNQEIEFDTEVIGGGAINFTFNNCVLKTSNDVSGSNFINTILNPSANLFVDKAKHDYHLADGSPAINAGDAVITVATDHDENPRSDGSPDVGAFEK
tara:strand:- start:1319 stop:2782 length:1464 start_codon:yes stop_codon:yes gene_type:complete